VQSTGNSTSRLFTFVGDSYGPWVVDHADCLIGEPLPAAPRLSVAAGLLEHLPLGAIWSLRGITSNERYVVREEKSALVKKQEALGRLDSTCASLIPIRKNSAWWALAQDERREVFEAQSHHVAIGLKYLPAVARRLHHCRDLGPAEPFDFLTWFEFAPSDSTAFDDLVNVLRASPEWQYVDREIEFRLVHAEA
jgi:hypothetical protein